MKPHLCRAFAAVAVAGVCAGGVSNVYALGRMAEVSVIDRDTGSTLPVYAARGQYWIAGAPGRRYAVALHNHTGNRVLVVMAIDGVNVVTGESAAWDQNGYVFDPDESSEIAGWRKSQTEIAAFEFTSLGDSYAARTGRPKNVGVIGVALFRERGAPQDHVPPPMVRPRADRESRAYAESPASAPAPVVQAAPGDEIWGGTQADSAAKSAARAENTPAHRAPSKLGTGHGDREDSWVEYTSFERAHNQPDEIVVLHYDSRENLIALGVIPPRPPMPSPNPFPGERNGFVPDPPARR
jgi:hypothetical protein